MRISRSIFPKRSIRFAAWMFFLVASSATASSGQVKDDEIIRIKTDLAAFEVSVSDREGRPVRGLTRDDFRLVENGIEKKIDFFEPIRRKDGTRPLSVVFALDVSGSMTAEELAQLKTALQKFVVRLADYNSNFAVMTFGMNVKVTQSFTNQPKKLSNAFEKLRRDDDGLSTHAYDAVDEAVRLIKKKSPQRVKDQIPRRAVILITDGFPVGDTVSPRTVIERANDAETTVYAVILPSFSRLQGSRKPLLTLLEASGLIERTGGLSFYADDRSFERLFMSLEEEITSSYVIAFYPKTESATTALQTNPNVKIESRRGHTVRQNRQTY